MWPEIIRAAASIAGNLLNKNSQERMSGREIALQKEFAQYGIRWRVEDAKAAGIHPLAALGAQTTSYSPMGVGDSHYRNMGQDISEAIQRGRDRKILQESTALDNEMKREQIKNMQLQNHGLKKSIEDVSPVQQTIPVVPEGKSALGVEVQPRQVTIGEKPGITAGIGHLEERNIDTDGFVWQHPDKQISEVMESSWPDQIKYTIRRFGAYLNNLHLHTGNKNVYTPGAIKARDKLREIRPAKEPGIEYRWDVWAGMFKRVKTHGRNDTYFYVDKRGGVPYDEGKYRFRGKIK